MYKKHVFKLVSAFSVVALVSFNSFASPLPELPSEAKQNGTDFIFPSWESFVEWSSAACKVADFGGMANFKNDNCKRYYSENKDAVVIFSELDDNVRKITEYNAKASGGKRQTRVFWRQPDTKYPGYCVSAASPNVLGESMISFPWVSYKKPEKLYSNERGQIFLYIPCKMNGRPGAK